MKQHDETCCRKRLDLEAGGQLGALTAVGPRQSALYLLTYQDPLKLYSSTPVCEDMRHRKGKQLAPGHTARVMLKQDNLVLEVILAPRSWCPFQQTSVSVSSEPTQLHS